MTISLCFFCKSDLVPNRPRLKCAGDTSRPDHTRTGSGKSPGLILPSGIRKRPGNRTSRCVVAAEETWLFTCRRSFTLSPIASPDRSIVLPGLPDDLAVLCLARVPRAVLARVVCVSKAWSVLIRSEELYKVRGENGLREPWLYALCESPRWGPWRVYDPMFSRWHTLPSKCRFFPWFLFLLEGTMIPAESPPGRF
jgi:hypothetical protein